MSEQGTLVVKIPSPLPPLAESYPFLGLTQSWRFISAVVRENTHLRRGHKGLRAVWIGRDMSASHFLTENNDRSYLRHIKLFTDN